MKIVHLFQKLVWTHTHTHTEQLSEKPAFYVFGGKEMAKNSVPTS